MDQEKVIIALRNMVTLVSALKDFGITLGIPGNEMISDAQSVLSELEQK